MIDDVAFGRTNRHQCVTGDLGFGFPLRAHTEKLYVVHARAFETARCHESADGILIIDWWGGQEVLCFVGQRTSGRNLSLSGHDPNSAADESIVWGEIRASALCLLDCPRLRVESDLVQLC